MSRDGNFLNSFKDSVTLYFVSGMWKKTEEDIGILRNGPSGFPVTRDFDEEFFKFIVEHLLCKFNCFYLRLTHLTSLFA